jgi:hypothetical protein
MKRFVLFLSMFVTFAAEDVFARTTICHVPPGNPENSRTIRVADPAVAKHLDHGDCEGECPCAVETCGDGSCDATVGESCESCAPDCGDCSFCGDGSCDTNDGETCDTCPSDCNACSPCGNGICDAGLGETDLDCPQDCGCAAAPAGCDAFREPAPAQCYCDEICVGNGDCCGDACGVCGRCS